MKKYNYNAIRYLFLQGYSSRLVAIVIGCPYYVARDLKYMLEDVEPTLKFLSKEQKERMYVLEKFLELRPITLKWTNDDYCYVTILKFLQVPRETIYSIYKGCPQRHLSNAFHEKAPIFKKFDYTKLQLTTSEYLNFVETCYSIIKDKEKWR